jgi:hypothetical protein
MESGQFRKRKEDKLDFFCPNGHNQHFVSETEADRLRKEVEEQKKIVANAQKRREWAEQELANERKAREKAERRIKRDAKRVGNGLCPCCNRSFENLQRHMHNKHPDYKEGQ